MPFNSVSRDNLQPFTGKDDPRRQNGRKTGSKNIKTITRKLLETDVDLALPINDDMKQFLGENGNRSYIEAITLAMLVKAVNGDVRAASLIFDRSDQLQIGDDESVFDKTKLVFKVVPDRKDYLEEKQKLGLVD